MNWRRVGIVARKDLLDAVRNGRIFVVIVMPVFFALLFGYLFSDLGSDGDGDGGNAEPPVVPVVAPPGSDFLARLEATGIYHFERVDSRQALEERLRADELAAGLVLPDGVDAAIGTGNAPPVEIITRQNTGQGAGLSALVLAVARELVGQTVPARFTEHELLPEGAEATTGNDDSSMLLTWLIMGLAFTGVTIVPTFIIEEREKKTLKALRSAGVSHRETLVAKAMVGLTYALLSALAVLAVGGGLTGSLGATVLFLAVGAWVMVELGLLIGHVFKDTTTLNTYGSFIALLMLLPGMLAGFSSGLFNLGPLNALMRLMPTYYVLDALNRAMQGSITPAQVVSNLAILLGFGVLLYAAVLWMMRREVA